MQKIDTLVVHCSDSLWGNAKEIDKWHKARGFKEIGYHYVVLNGTSLYGLYDPLLDGVIEPGRNLDNNTQIEESEVGAHALGFNQHSIGICLIGGAGGKKVGFTIPQYWAALTLVNMWKHIVPSIKILGHNETGAPKPCPVLDMPRFRGRLDMMDKSLSFNSLSLDIRERGF